MTHATDSTHDQAGPTLVMAMDLGRGQWRLGFTIGAGQRPRSRTIRGDDWRRLGDEIAAAKAKFGLPPDSRVVSCYEAGPDGFWIHRYLITLGVESLVVDPASIEVNRRGRQANRSARRRTARGAAPPVCERGDRCTAGGASAKRGGRASPAVASRVHHDDAGPRARPESHERLARHARAARTGAV